MNKTIANLTIETHRQEFPGLANKLYFNFGGQGTMPLASLEAIIDFHELLQQQGPFSLRVNATIKQRINQLRTAIAEEIGAQPENITLTENVTQGCNIALWGIDWQVGDKILLSDCEHPGIIAIVQEIARRFDLEFSFCPLRETLNQGDPVAVVQKYLTPQTRLLVISHLLWNTGQLLPLSAIVETCHQHGVQVLVDAAQTVGAIPLSLEQMGVDYYAFTGHKWLCGPAGVGGLYVNPTAAQNLHPTFIGWRSIEVDEQGKITGWKRGGERFEVATSAYPQYEGLRTAMIVHNQWGTIRERYEQICQLSAYLWENLAKIPQIKCLKTSPPAGGLVSFQVTAGNISHLQLVQNLERQGLFLRTIANPDCVRACVHYFTLPSEIEQLAIAIKKLCS
ncbi:MAG: aminotransferase class V-fold PLP-dependent enzyme [Cyanobacteria bacterium J083]|nr:MAG: aminotransferase class V-fold PLP-dependent enzyme [Cyanobacteria bacterium J083]